MVKTQKNKHKSKICLRKSRRVIGSRTYKNYTEDMLQLACEMVASKQMSSRDAEQHFGIPRRTIINKNKKIHLKCVGHPTSLTIEEEDKIVKVLQASSDYGYPLTKLDLKLLVFTYLKNNGREIVFKNNIPGDAWVQGFLVRNADKLSVRTTQNITRARAEKGPLELATYFENLKITLKDIPASNIINLDETNLSDDPGSSKSIFRRGVKYPERIANFSKGNISLMFTVIASGECLPLYVVYKANNLYSEWITGGPPGTRYNCSKSGWFDGTIFEDYFKTIIIPWAKETPGTKVVICDNLSSHLSVKIIDLCEQCNIKFIFIPSRSTHLTQPLDVAFFAPLKRAWRQILYQYKLKNPNQETLNKKHFPKLLVQLMDAARLTENKNIKSGFRACGIFPLNAQEVLKKIPEMQGEVLSYGLDQALIDYLKETRAPRPMEVKRNKKIKCEPGRSVSVCDFNITVRKKDAVTVDMKAKTKNENLPELIKSSTSNNVLFLDDRTGLFTKTNIISSKRFQNSAGYQQSPPIPKKPESLCKYSIDAINSFFYSLSEDKKSYHKYFGTSNVATIGNSKRTNNPKVTILSNVLYKAANQTLDGDENTPFIAYSKQNLPKCLQEQEIPKLKTKKVNTSKRRIKSNTSNKPSNSKAEKRLRRRTFINRTRKQSFCDSTSSDCSIKLADSSDCETIHDFYISEFLREQEEKENLEPMEIKFGLSEIEYHTEEQGDLTEGDWIIARFTSKKSLKHFVGKVLSVLNKRPTVKFVRKVKQFKSDKSTTFTYPNVDDIYTIQNLEDIMSILPEPTISRRGQIIFNVDFSNLNIQ